MSKTFGEIGGIEQFLPELDPRVIVGIDPADTTGLAFVDADVRGGIGLLSSHEVRIDRAGFTQAQAIQILESYIGQRPWAVAIERPFGNRVGGGRAPAHAERFWRDAVDLLARLRCERADGRFRKPTVFRPRPQDWRKALGVPVRGFGATYDQRRASIIARVVERLFRLYGLKVTSPDVAMAISIAEWARRAAPHPTLVKRFAGVDELRWAA